MKIALGLLVIGLAFRDARAESYRALPRLPPAKVRQRAAAASRGPAIPPARVEPEGATRGSGTGEGAEPDADVRRVAAGSPEAAPKGIPTRPASRRQRRTGPPPPLQDELGRIVVFAAAPHRQGDAGRPTEDPEGQHDDVHPSAGDATAAPRTDASGTLRERRRRR